MPRAVNVGKIQVERRGFLSSEEMDAVYWDTAGGYESPHKVKRKLELGTKKRWLRMADDTPDEVAAGSGKAATSIRLKTWVPYVDTHSGVMPSHQCSVTNRMITQLSCVNRNW